MFILSLQAVCYSQQIILLLFLTVAISKQSWYGCIKGVFMTDNIYLDSDTSEEVASEFNRLVSNRRKELNLSVRELGTKADVSYTVIYDLEQRNTLPKMETMIKLGVALGFRFTIKRSNNKEKPALSLIFYDKSSNETQDLERKMKAPQLTPEEQLEKLLKQRGLYTSEIEELKSYIAFKLSQH